jgi:Nucleotidyltransferase of unknown function (DUF6036)
VIGAWSKHINRFVELCNLYGVRMIMVGGGAVNFHGYQRHSADVDFWIDTSEENLRRLIHVLMDMDYEISDFPDTVKQQMKNISIKFSPNEMNLELITRFLSGKTFDEAYKTSVSVEVKGQKVLKWRVLDYDDLIDSKLKSQRPKDLLDIQELQRINNSRK